MYLCSTDMTVLQVLMYVVLQLAITKTIDSFEYNFPVNSTKTCPMNAKEWSDASIRMHCNDTHGYHCVPDKNFSSLIEFCYPRGRRIPFQKGNCLELAYTGILNHVKCGHFTYGCPDKDYFSNEIYQYPACLRLADNCFAADLSCLKKEYSIQKQIDKTETNSSCLMKQSTREENTYTALIVAVIIISVFLLSMILVVLILCQKIHKQKQPAKDKEEDIHESLLDKKIKTIEAKGPQRSRNNQEPQGSTNEVPSEQPEGNNQEPQSPTNEVPSEQPEEYCTASSTKESGRKTNQETNTSDDIGRYIFVDFTVEDAALFDLLKRQCLNGCDLGFKYLVDTKVISRKKNAIFHQYDDNGCTLLHYAAQGGSIIILEIILKNDSEAKLENKCYRGQNALHFAIKSKKEEMSKYLITQYGVHFMKCRTIDFNQSSREKERETTGDNTGEFEPFHWIAWNGDLRILEVLKKASADLSGLTRNHLSVLDIACMKKENEFCRHVIENEKQIDLEKVDSSGWNIAHYAAMSNNVDVLKLLESEHVSLIKAKTKADKSSLHIACEYGSREAVFHLISYFQSLLKHSDVRGWNALHFAAKGGNLDILKELLKTMKFDLNSLTNEGKTLLHIACTYKHVEICKYVANTFFLNDSGLINQKTTNHGWSAAHYVGVERKEDGSEVKIIDILHDCKMKLYESRTKKGYSVLDIAIDHLNIELIEHLLSSKYRAVLKITKKSIMKLKEHTKNEEVLKILNKALSEMD